MTLDDCPTFDLSPIWLFIEAVAEVRVSRNPPGVRVWGDKRHTEPISIAGEVGVSLITGQPLVSCLEDGPDLGGDVANVNVKATGYWPPILKKLEESKWDSEWYALAHVSPEHVVTYIGCVSRDDFLTFGYRTTFAVSARYGVTVCLDAEEVLRLTLLRRSRATA